MSLSTFERLVLWHIEDESTKKVAETTREFLEGQGGDIHDIAKIHDIPETLDNAERVAKATLRDLNQHQESYGLESEFEGQIPVTPQ